MIGHCGARIAVVQGFIGDKHVTLVTDRVGVVYLIQDNNGVSEVAVYKMSPEVGLVCLSPSESLDWT